MEILIPGLILVALMIYTSTKIKAAAAQALEPELVETDDFLISKPAGFINILSPDDGLLFHAYTKEFADDAPAFRRAQATVRSIGDSDARQIYNELKQTADPTSYEAKGGVDDLDFTVKVVENDVRLIRAVKLLRNYRHVYRLQFDTPEECSNDYNDAMHEMIDTFRLKH